MLATLIDEPFDSPDWIFETKWDGYRAIADVNNHKIHLYSRNGLSFNSTFKPVVEALKKLKLSSALLDGEIVVYDKNNKPQFQNVQNYRTLQIGRVVYIIFDLLFLEGYDLREFPLIKRKELLKQVIKNSEHLHYCEHVEEKGIEFFRKTVIEGGEGMIAKQKESPYHSMRTQSWLKIKTRFQQEAIICGYTEPKGLRKHFGALLLGVYTNGKLTYAGHTGSGFDQTKLTEVYHQLAPLIQKNCPFETKPKTRFSTTWVNPQLVCEIVFAGWTKENLMRQAIFQGLRVDKQVNEITREKTMPTEEAAENKKMPKANNGKASSLLPIKNLTLSHLDKVFWPNEGYTKGDLIHYYEKVAPFIIPYLKDRPETLIRYPHGIAGEHFFQKEAVNLSKDIRTVIVPHDHGQVHYLVIDDLRSLLYTINLGCIDLNPFDSRIQKLHYPDYLIIDLDPEDIAFEFVIETAKEVYRLLEEWGIPSVCKTSGASGMHIYVPIGAKYTFEETTYFAKLIAYKVHERIPEFTSVERSPSNRQKKVYLDFLQNRFGANVASVYSVRPQAGACVSTPLKWSEVKKGLTPCDFTIKNVHKRLEKVGDLFKPVLGKGIDFKKILTKLANEK